MIYIKKDSIMTPEQIHQYKQWEPSQSFSKAIQRPRGLSQDAIISDPMSGVRTTTSMINQIGNVAFISKIEPKISDEALSD